MQRQTMQGQTKARGLNNWLAQFTYSLISITMFALTSMVKGDSQFSTSKGKICVMVRNLDEIQDKENTLQYHNVQ